MRRPLVLVGFCYLLTLAAAVFFGAEGSFFLLWFCVAGFSATFVWWRTRRAVVFPLAFATAAVALTSFCIYSHRSVEPPRALDGREEAVTGTVCELPEHCNGRWYYVVRVDEDGTSGAPTGYKIRLSSRTWLDAGPYSRVTGKVRLFLPTGREGYSSMTYYASKGIMMFAYLPTGASVSVSPPEEKPPYYYALRMRQKLLRSVEEILPPEEAALVNGILLGETDGLSQSLTADFRTDGVSHILSVSGLHMSTIAELLIFLLLFFRVPKRPAAAAAACGVFGFMAVTCFVPSVTRSGVMCLLCLAGPLVSRRADPLNSLCTAGLLVCLANPYAAADIGLLLSFSATLGLIVCTGPVMRFLNGRFDRVRVLSPLVRGVNGILATSAGATLFTLPIILLNFGTVSVVAPLANLLELVPSSLLMCFGAAAAVLNLFLPGTYLAMPFALAAGLLAKYMSICASFLARIPLASISASQGFVTVWLAGTLVLFAAALALGKGKKLFPQAACLSVIVLLVGVLSFQISQNGVTRLAVLDAGDGISVVLTRGGHAAVIGCGSYNSSRVISYLNSENVSQLDVLAVLTEQRDEFSCAADVAGRFGPARVIADADAAADGFVREASSSSPLTAFSSRAAMQFWSNVTVEFVRSNKASAAKITAGDVTVVLCPDGVKRKDLPAGWFTPDFLVVGKKASAIDGFSPVCTVFSVDSETLGDSSAAVRRRRSLWTGGYGNLVLSLHDGRRLSIGREN
jgi:competence protein ComEC